MRSKAALGELEGQDGRRRSGAGGRGDLRGARQGWREDHRRSATRPSCPRRSRTPSRSPARSRRKRRDGAAIARFLRWVETEAPKGEVDELKASDHLEALRREDPELRDLSFDSISGAGPNGAIVHYRSSEKTNRKLEAGTLYLIDSGGQYLDGTTDITRTVAIGEPTAGDARPLHPRAARATSRSRPRSSRRARAGRQLDSFARRPLWEAGLDYAHGTGHGVGSFLSVHEGPQRISPAGSAQAGGDEPLRAGMILSNEPGYYKTGAYGIRIENLVLVVEKPVEGAEKETLGFETLTFAPIERRLVDVSMLSEAELQVAQRLSCRGAGQDRPAAGGGRQGMARKAVRAAKPLGWMALGGAITATWMLGPRVAVNRALDAGYSLAGWVGILLRLSRRASRACAFLRRRFSRSAAASRSSAPCPSHPCRPTRRSLRHRARLTGETAWP